MRLSRRAVIACSLLAVAPLQAATPGTGHPMRSPTTLATPRPPANGSSMPLRAGPAVISGTRAPAHVAAPVINGSAMRHGSRAR